MPNANLSEAIPTRQYVMPTRMTDLVAVSAYSNVKRGGPNLHDVEVKDIDARIALLELDMILDDDPTTKIVEAIDSYIKSLLITRDTIIAHRNGLIADRNLVADRLNELYPQLAVGVSELTDMLGKTRSAKEELDLTKAQLSELIARREEILAASDDPEEGLTANEINEAHEQAGAILVTEEKPLRVLAADQAEALALLEAETSTVRALLDRQLLAEERLYTQIQVLLANAVQANKEIEQEMSALSRAQEIVTHNTAPERISRGLGRSATWFVKWINRNAGSTQQSPEVIIMPIQEG